MIEHQWFDSKTLPDAELGAYGVHELTSSARFWLAIVNNPLASLIEAELKQVGLVH
jgi:hypothetical protein